MSKTTTETLEGGSIKTTKEYTWRSEYFTEKDGDGSRTMQIHRIKKSTIGDIDAGECKCPAIQVSLESLKARDAINGLTFEVVEAYLTELSDQLADEEVIRLAQIELDRLAQIEAEE